MTAEAAMHTPGPWIVDEDDPHVILAPDGDDDPWFVAEAAYDCGPDMSGKANARLIAAAPDMLAALRGAEALITNDVTRDFGATLAANPMPGSVLANIRTALAKATA